MATIANVDTAMVARLLADANVTALIGNRIYGGAYAPQGTQLPYLTYETSDEPVGASDVVDYVSRQTSINLWCHADQYGQCRDLAEAVMASLGTWDPSADSISTFQVDTNTPDQAGPTQGEEQPMHIRLLACTAWSGEID